MIVQSFLNGMLADLADTISQGLHCFHLSRHDIATRPPRQKTVGEFDFSKKIPAIVIFYAMC